MSEVFLFQEKSCGESVKGLESAGYILVLPKWFQRREIDGFHSTFVRLSSLLPFFRRSSSVIPLLFSLLNSPYSTHFSSFAPPFPSVGIRDATINFGLLGAGKLEEPHRVTTAKRRDSSEETVLCAHACRLTEIVSILSEDVIAPSHEEKTSSIYLVLRANSPACCKVPFRPFMIFRNSDSRLRFINSRLLKTLE